MTTETLVTGPADTTAGTTQADTTASTTTQTTANTDATATQQTDATKAGEQGNGQGDKKDASTDADKAIEYTDFKAPEGIDLDSELLGEFKTFAAARKLSQEDAQAVVDLGAKLMQKQAAAFTETVDGWGKAAKTDKEIGGDKFDENLAVAKKALDAFGTPEFKEALRFTGMGNHPEVLRFMHRVGKAISEDGFVKGQPGSAAKPFYENSNLKT